MDQCRGREQDRLFFFPGGRADGGGEECQHLCWGYFLFYSCFLRDTSECYGENSSPGLPATSCLSTWAHIALNLVNTAL